MNTRKRLIITAVAVCHGLLAPALLFSQVQAADAVNGDQAAVAEADPQARGAYKVGRLRPGEPITIKADIQEEQDNVYKLHGNVEISFRTYTLKADEMTYDDRTGEIEAIGHVVFDGGPNDEHLTASHGSYNQISEVGHFYDVVGTTGARMRGRNVVLTSSTPFSFVGRQVDVEGRRRIVVHHGTVTSCAMPRPKWWFRAEEVSVVAGEDARIYNSSFWFWRVPLLYFPFFDHPVEHMGRKSGFLLPSIGRSSRKGNIVGESFFWAMNRSMDATMGAEYYSKRGWAQHGEFRARLTEDSSIMATYFGVLDRGLATTETVPGPTPQSPPVTLPAHTDQGGQELRVNASGFLLSGLRGVADIDYLSSYVFRAAFSESFTQAINSEVRSTAFLTKDWHGYSFNAMSSRYQNFSTNTQPLANVPETVETIVHAPSFEASSIDRRIGRSPLYWGFDVAGEGLSRREPSFVTANVVGRYDAYPRLSMPLRWREWSLLPEVAVRDTWYGSRQVQKGIFLVPTNEAINRRAFQGSVELRPPALSRIFESKATSRRLKHVFEPRVVYSYTRGVDNFSNILRFDARDILSDTNEVEYAMVNRLYSRKVGKGCEKAATSIPEISDPADDCSAREIVSWELAQKHFLDPGFGGALVPGRINVFTTTEELTGIAFLIQPRSFSPIVSRLRARGPGADVEWHLDYDTKLQRINSSMALVDYKLPGNFRIGGGHAFLQAAGDAGTTNTLAAAINTRISSLKFNQFRVNAAYGNLSKPGIAAGATIGFDANQSFLQYSAVQTTYNWDCCGLTFEYRRFALGSVRNENQFRFALSLSNVGTFGTLRRQERLF